MQAEEILKTSEQFDIELVSATLKLGEDKNSSYAAGSVFLR